MNIFTKFSPFDQVWFMEHNKPIQLPIVSISVFARGLRGSGGITQSIVYSLDAGCDLITKVSEENLFRSKKELLNSL